MRLLLPVSVVLFLASCAPADDAAVDGFAPAASLSDADLEVAARRHLSAFDGDDLAVGADPLRGLRLTRVGIDDLLQSHARFQQEYGGVPVFGGEVVVHFDADGTLQGVTDDRIPDVDVDVDPLVAMETAIEVAVADALPDGWQGVTEDPVASLVVVRREGVDHLAWKVQLHRLPGDGDDAMPLVFVDAHDARVVWAFENLQSLTCSGTTNYYGAVSVDCYSDGTSYFLEDTAEKLATFT